ncbi:hypothetical protein DGG96_05750 [Legionella qingyii]|uniref:Uncharacterized protein n=1 Tax=Legionella qingyii TaxID=2184757 RepID=A0A317U5U7_9GAMM|nr:hypothetical protein [Legionella qingyii]PWY56625.1 hypothetical protein DGG96_05750 [Legionella qingyii]RUR23438.1 hypothetical protein ELY20_07475 [Legionella qingyii]RUR26115.1 hypothetical protein ELY16_08200 [Legionella qingyii]
MAVTKKRFKKIPHYLALASLTVGASLILGFLSFSGMYALYPALYLAFAAFGLSVAYEGEVYLQNLKGSFKKLFKSNYLENHLAKEYLLENFPENTNSEECPQFFKDYEIQLKLLSEFNNKPLDKESRKRKKQIEKALSDMEKWFALQLFAAKTKESEKLSHYTQRLRDWLKNHGQNQWQERLEQRKSTFNFVKGFSLLAATFMGLGSTYLIVEAFSVIPLIAAIPFALWPIFVVPMAVIAGAAYGMLTYNTITDLINNDTIKKWYTKLSNDLSQGLTARNVLIASIAIFLVSLAIALTVCTAGTWWTVATSARPLFEWMKKIPSFVMGLINPIITGLSAIFFNIQNSSESLEMVYEATDSNTGNIFQRAYKTISEGLTHVWDTENWLQMINPFRIILKLTVAPLRILLFLGHLVSVALTSDRMPGIPQIISALVAIISEGFEDAHYFIGSNNHKQKTLLEERLGSEAGHEQGTDIPTQLLKFIASPLYFLAAGWDYLASKMNSASHDAVQKSQPKMLSFSQAWNKQLGIPEEINVSLAKDAKQPSKEWKVEHTLSLIEKYERKHLDSVRVNTTVADDKKDQLEQLKNKVRATLSDNSAIYAVLTEEKDNPIYNQPRLFALRKDEKTTTQEFIEALPERVNAI